MGRGKGRDRGREARWRELVREQSRSGLSVRQFCAVHGLRETSFYFWRRELQRRRRERSRGRNGRPGDSGSTPPPTHGLFLPVVVSPTALAEPAPIEIVLADAVVRVPPQFDAQSLARVVETLRGVRGTSDALDSPTSALGPTSAARASRETRSC